MPDQVARTGVTSLSDGELLILDFAATNGGCRSMYRPDRFSLMFNCPSHRLADTALTSTLDHFESQGWITGVPMTNWRGEPDRTLRITPASGQLWEAEREPDWSRFVFDEYRFGLIERNRLSIFGHASSICEAFFDLGCQSGFFDYRRGRMARGIGRRKLFDWRPAQTVFLLSAWLESEGLPTDWSHLEMKRSWWRFPKEIGKFWGWPAAIDG